MTLEEAQRVAMICSMADGQCGNCIRSLVNYLNGIFTEFEWSFDDTKYMEFDPDECITILKYENSKVRVVSK